MTRLLLIKEVKAFVEDHLDEYVERVLELRRMGGCQLPLIGAVDLPYRSAAD